MRRYILLVFIVVLLGAVYLTGFFIKKERSFTENLRLKQENQDLRAQIQHLTDFELPNENYGTAPSDEKYLRAKVFSTYPFNIKNEITVNAGEKQGVKLGTIATIGDNILVGQIIKVFDNASIIQTIFDPNLELPVRIGKEEINGMLQAGAEPKVILIEKPVGVGDVVYSAVAEFPYGLKIGEITQIKESAAGVFKEASIKIPFTVSELREIKIRKP